MTLRNLHTLVTALMTTAALEAAGQVAPSDSLAIHAGDHVRMRMRDEPGRSVNGWVRELRPDSVRLVYGPGDTAWVARSSIVAMEARRGERFQASVVETMAGIGMVAGGVAAIMWCAKDRGACAAENRGQERAAALDETYIGTDLLLISAGGLAGALLGWGIAPLPHWEKAVWPTFGGGTGWGASGGRVATLRLGVRVAF